MVDRIAFQDWTPGTKALCQIRFNSILNGKYTRRHHHNLLKDTWPDPKDNRHENADYFDKSQEIHDYIKRTLKKDANAYYNDVLKGCCKFLGIEEDWVVDNRNDKSGFQLHNFGLVLKKIINMHVWSEQSSFGRRSSYSMVSFFKKIECMLLLTHSCSNF